MIRAKITLPDGSEIVKKILVIDAHSHLGSDIDSVNNMNPLAAGGTFNFYVETESKIRNDSNLNFETNINGGIHRFDFEFIPFPFNYNIFKYLREIASGSHASTFDKMDGGWLIDQGVCFPFQDTFRDKKPEAQYRASNLNIARFTTHFPYSLRLIGYCRVNPRQTQAPDEVDFAINKLGLRGLKLHPRSDGWTDEISEDFAVKVLIKAAKNSIPAIFDTRGVQSILDIHDLVIKTRNELKKRHPELVPHLKVIVAHCAMGYIGNQKVYNVISDPNIWGEISMLHGQGTRDFFLSFMNWYNQNFDNQNYKIWSEKLIFGSDFPYFTPIHAKDNIKFLISKEFFDNGGTLTDSENILGLNIIKLLSNYSLRPKLNKKDYSKHSHVYLAGANNHNLYETASYLTAVLIENKRLDINQINFMFDGNFRNISNNILIQGTLNTDKKTRILVHNYIENMLLYSTLDSEINWNYFGFKYFNPSDQLLFIKAIEMNMSDDFNSQYQIFNKNLL